MDYYAIELHSHTKHSDGGFTTEGLLGSAKASGYDILMITDHNTVAPYEERLQMQIEQNGLIHHLGQELQVGDAQLQVRMESILQEKLRNFGFKGERLAVIQNEEVIAEIELKESQ